MILVHCAAVKYTFNQYLARFAVLMLEVCIMIIFRHYQIKKVMAGGPNLQGMDSLTAAMQNNIVPDQEYLLQVPFIEEDLFHFVNFVSDQGSILDSKVDVLNHRLKGLCDNVDTDRETYDEKEMVFSIRGRASLLCSIAIPNFSMIRHSNSTPHTSSEAQYGP